MSHSRAIWLRFAIIRGMSRCALLVVCVAAACSKSAGNQDKVASLPPSTGGADVIAVPPPTMAGAPGAARAEPAQAKAAQNDPRFKLKPEEGQLVIEPPGDVAAGSEAVARITVTPGKGYKVNTEYPTKLTLTPATGVTLAKDRFTAGGHDKAKGDADMMDEKQLTFAVKLTPAASGTYTINGNFKFAVCDADQCLAKQENISIAVAAK
jgi:hypothetical protein